MPGIHTVFLAGAITAHGVSTTFLPESGAMVGCFSLAIPETGGGGKRSLSMSRVSVVVRRLRPPATCGRVIRY